MLNAGEIWDPIAKNFLTRLQNSTTDLLLDTLAEFDAVPEGGTVLDICCGPGWHLQQMADKIESGVGIDASGNMIELARAHAQENGADNLSFIQHDWTQGTPAELPGTFDLVIANRCPAIQNGDDLRRLQALSRDVCVVASPIYKHNSVLDEILPLLPGSPAQITHAGSQRFVESVGTIIREGGAPQLRYHQITWQRTHDREELKDEVGMHVRDYGPELFDAIDQFMSPEESVDIELTMCFALAIWKVPQEGPVRLW